MEKHSRIADDALTYNDDHLLIIEKTMLTIANHCFVNNQETNVPFIKEVVPHKYKSRKNCRHSLNSLFPLTSPPGYK